MTMRYYVNRAWYARSRETRENLSEQKSEWSRWSHAPRRRDIDAKVAGERPAERDYCGKCTHSFVKIVAPVKHENEKNIGELVCETVLWQNVSGTLELATSPRNRQLASLSCIPVTPLLTGSRNARRAGERNPSVGVESSYRVLGSQSRRFITSM